MKNRPTLVDRIRAALATCLLPALLIPTATAAPDDLEAADHQRLVASVCRHVEEFYPFADIADRTVSHLRARLAAGAYDRCKAPRTFAADLTADLEHASDDLHLDLDFDPDKAAGLREKALTGKAQTGPTRTRVATAAWDHFGFREIRILDGRIGYLDLRSFFASRYAGSTAVAAMDMLAGTNAVIIDLRRNGGGWDDQVMLLASYFVDVEEPELVALTRSTLDGSYVASSLSSHVPGERLTGRPVYLLTSSSTASAAEAFASVLRHINREVVLVGSRTAGAENPVESLVLEGDFVLKIPCYEKIDFGTRQGWEGAGLAPDIEVDAGRALDTAHLHALCALRERLTGDLAADRITWAIDGLRARAEPVALDRQALEAYLGTYRDARVTLDRNLRLQFDGGTPYRLHAVAEDYFIVEGRDDLRIRFVRDGGRVSGFERVYDDGYRALHPAE